MDELNILLKNYAPSIAIAVYLLIRFVPRFLKILDLYIEILDYKIKNKY